jgi:sterol desaturase/sphingolipid hydroxylase (fatty acid hydroxylase superfamily)
MFQPWQPERFRRHCFGNVSMALFDIWDLVLVGVIFVPLERLMPLRAEQAILRDAWKTDLAHLFASGMIIKFGLVGIIGLILFLSHLAVPEWIRSSVAGQPFIVQLAEVVLLADLGFYLAHRAFHEIPGLWKFHAVHHSIEHLDWLAAARVHPVDQIVTRGISFLPIFALGFSPEPILLFAVLYKWQSALIHSNTRVGFGPLRWLFASPRFHHWHHANCAEALDKNFGGQLVIFDLLFGTLHFPQTGMPERYGTDDPVPKTYLEQLSYPLPRRHRAG